MNELAKIANNIHFSRKGNTLTLMKRSQNDPNLKE